MRNATTKVKDWDWDWDWDSTGGGQFPQRTPSVTSTRFTVVCYARVTGNLRVGFPKLIVM